MNLLPNYDLIAPDFPGFGNTSPPPVAWCVDDYTKWILTLMDALALAKVNIVGHSFGGRIGIKLASQYPERVARLVLTGSAGIVPKRTLAYHIKVRTYKILRSISNAHFAPEFVRVWSNKRIKNTGSSDYQQAAGTVRSSLVKVVNEDLRNLLPHISAPTLLVWGDKDEATPLSDARLMEQLIPDSGLVIFEKAGHYAYIEHSQRFATILKTFLS
jgi:pimeloyl-ACP methyl ester carboxylesterase